MSDSRDMSVKIDKWNIGNSSQRAEVVDTVYYQIVRPDYSFGDRFSLFMHQLINAPLRYTNYDLRWRESKAYDKARQELFEALRNFDEAHVALLGRIKRGRKR